MLTGVRRVLLAVSGGRDSTAMAYNLMPFLRADTDIIIGHVHHGLRGSDADRDEAFVQDLADSLQVPFVSERLGLKKAPHGQSHEGPARKARYGAFRRWADAYGLDAIATAHTLDDQVETFFLRLLRGCSLTGLSGIPPVRRLSPACTCKLIRPMLDVTRRAITEWLAQHNLAFREDATNQDRRIPRNAVRHGLIPEVMAHAPAGLYPTVRRLQQEATQLKAEARRTMQMAWRNRTELMSPDGHLYIVLRKGALRTLSSQAIHELLTVLLVHFQVSPEKLTGSHSKDFQAFLATDRTMAKLPGGIQAWGTHGAIHFRLPGPSLKPPDPMDLPLHRTIHFGSWALRCETVRNPAIPEQKNGTADPPAMQRTEMIDTHSLDWPLTIRTRCPGDRFQPLGAQGHQKLKEFFRASRIPPWCRDAWPIVCAGEKIVWIPGLRIAEPVRITGQTTRAASLQIESLPEPAALCLTRPLSRNKH